MSLRRMQQNYQKSNNITTIDKIGVWLIVILIFLIIILGVYYTKQHYKKICLDEMIPAYNSGFVRGLTNNMNDFILECKPYNVEAFAWTNLKNQQIGTILRCSSNNETFAITNDNI